MNKLYAWYGALQAREQRVVLIGGIVLALLVLFGVIVLPLEAAVSSAVKRSATKREDLAWMRRNAPEVQASGSQLPADVDEAPMVLVDRLARAAGLTDALRGTQPSGPGVRVQFEGASFDTLITWLATLDQRYGLSVEAITVDRAAKPGLVNANVTLAPRH